MAGDYLSAPTGRKGGRIYPAPVARGEFEDLSWLGLGNLSSEARRGGKARLVSAYPDGRDPRGNLATAGGTGASASTAHVKRGTTWMFETGPSKKASLPIRAVGGRAEKVKRLRDLCHYRVTTTTDDYSKREITQEKGAGLMPNVRRRSAACDCSQKTGGGERKLMRSVAV